MYYNGAILVYNKIVHMFSIYKIKILKNEYMSLYLFGDAGLWGWVWMAISVCTCAIVFVQVPDEV